MLYRYDNGTGDASFDWIYPYDNYWNYDRSKPCHGCNGKGWIETSDHKVHKCPVCNGSGYVRVDPYDLSITC